MGILVPGSLHYDIMIDVPHQPEKGETVLGSRTSFKFGGKGGNQAISCAKQGQKVRFVGAIGDDANGSYLVSVLKDTGVDVSHIQKLPGLTSGMSVAMTDKTGDYAAVVSSNTNQLIPLELFDDESVWADISMVVLQNEINPQANEKVGKSAKKRGIKVCMNAAPITDAYSPVFDHVDLMVVNAVEARDICGISVNDLDSAKEAAIALTKRFSEVVVTAGGDGVAYANVKGTNGCIQGKRINLVSTHGAGDCFMGALCAQLNSGKPLEQACSYANDIAAIHVSTPSS
ncbi:ribokinase [Vibrio sp. DW001]|uniref:ribokinase n=1 Tax=Vibrio sp. DW001 TaxID=2912315 RepID=UPI0023AF557C|nr:ribokinase [Vibrio sp. DW001]WED25785.1 ribokinase [Vibrio sp. DW001]